ncbi:MAG: SDR family NAD(P)-dependent oxidoreductase, partial [Gemmatimonadota bacterium]|nr:SDR family NAD(P)-dependent oxidoreductase [Gemmatimonadota bacterium]
MKLLDGLEVVVTGGTGALGRAVVEGLAREGARCCVPVRAESQAATVEALAATRIEVPTGIDVTEEAPVEELFAAYGADRPLWASIHLVGGFHWGSLADSPLSVFDEMISLNARSCYLACRAAAAAMMR